jgi:hypothetical protein
MQLRLHTSSALRILRGTDPQRRKVIQTRKNTATHPRPKLALGAASCRMHLDLTLRCALEMIVQSVGESGKKLG